MRSRSLRSVAQLLYGGRSTRERFEALAGRLTQVKRDKGPIDAYSQPAMRAEFLAGGSEKTSERVDARHDATAFDARDHGLGYARSVRELALCEPGAAPSLPERLRRIHTAV